MFRAFSRSRSPRLWMPRNAAAVSPPRQRRCWRIESTRNRCLLLSPFARDCGAAFGAGVRRAHFLGLGIGTSQTTLPVGVDLSRSTPPIAFSGALSAFSASVRNGWPRRWVLGQERDWRPGRTCRVGDLHNQVELIAHLRSSVRLSAARARAGPKVRVDSSRKA